MATLGSLPALSIQTPQIDLIGSAQQSRAADLQNQAAQQQVTKQHMEMLAQGAAYALDGKWDQPADPKKWGEVIDSFEAGGMPRDQAEQLRSRPDLAPVLLKSSHDALMSAEDQTLFPLKMKEMQAQISEHMAAARAKGDQWSSVTDPADRAQLGIDPKDKGIYQVNGTTGELKSFSGKGQTINVGAKDTGEIPPGYMVTRDAGGNITGEVPIPGGPAAQKVADAQSATDTKTNQAQVSADIVTTDIQRALDKIDTDPKWTTGMGAAATKYIPASDAKSVEQFVDTVKANASIDKLQQMRNSSPTGAALGSISDKEDKMLGDAIGSLDQTMQPEDFKYNLKRVYNIYKDIVDGKDSGQRFDLAKKDAPLADIGSKAPTKAKNSPGGPDERMGAAPPDGVTSDEWSVMTPEEKKLWLN